MPRCRYTGPEARCPVCDGAGAYGVHDVSGHIIREVCHRCKGTGVIEVHHHIWTDIARRHIEPEAIPDELQSLFARAIEETHAWLESCEGRTTERYVRHFELGSRAATLLEASLTIYKPFDRLRKRDGGGGGLLK